MSWTTPSGFQVVHIYNKIGSRRSLAKLFNNKELSFYFRTKDVDIRSAKQAISPNYIHSLDAAHMFLTIYALILLGFEDFSRIHDSYGCHAPMMGVMMKVIREEFAKMHSENLLEKFYTEIRTLLGTELPKPPERGDLDINDVVNSLYFFA